jgi:beta-lactamase regulating signal transducer with metallopeptidase domain
MDAVLNWLWQGGVVALAAAALLRVIPRSHTLARYCAAWTACIVVLALPAAPFLLGAVSPIQADYRLPAPGPVVAMPHTWWTSTSLAIGLWILWAIVHARRLAAAGLSLRRARRQCREFPESVEANLHYWSHLKTTGRRTRLVLSSRVRSAAVLGCGSPLIGIAPGLLEHIGEEDLDRIVVHEWAHVQRRDDIAQYLELLIRVIAGWHPAVWWLERQMELEREVACDETVVVVTGSAKGYAACLTTLAGLPPAVRPLTALAAVSSSGLRRRIVRILALRQGGSSQSWRVIAIGAAAALATLALAVGNVHVVKLAVPVLSLRAASQSWVETAVGQDARTLSGTESRPTSLSRPAMARQSRWSAERATLANGPASVADVETAVTAELPAVVMSVVPSQPLAWPLDNPVSPSVEMFGAAGTPVTPVIEPVAPVASDNNRQTADPTVLTPWSAAANAGVAVGRGSQNAGIATAGFFTRVGKRIAGSF